MAKFTSGHIRQVALVLKSEMPNTPDINEFYQWCAMCKAFAIRFTQNNERFDAVKFYKTCGIEDEKAIQELMKL